ncbi:MAG TPA: pyruvate synthase subunit PorB [bacterium]|nr:pyruvate synthase subunit PorB [bacterium]
MAEEAKAKRVTPKSMPREEYMVGGHRACQGCAEALAVRIILKAAGKDTILAMATGCMEIVSTPLPTTAWTMPWIHVAFENAAAVASGIESGLKALMRKGRLPQKRINIIGMAGDGGTADIGFQALSGALERGHDMTFFCLDNEAYMNTGIQRSSSTPYGASTTTSPAGSHSIGQQTWKKPMAEIAAAHRIPYVAQASSAYPLDLFKKTERALAAKGPAYVHVLSVCPTGWRIPSEKAIEYGKLATQTGIFPLYEVIAGEYHMTMDLKSRKPVSDYFKGHGRFRHLTPDKVQEIQQRVDQDWERLRAKCVNVKKGGE